MSWPIKFDKNYRYLPEKLIVNLDPDCIDGATSSNMKIYNLFRMIKKRAIEVGIGYVWVAFGVDSIREFMSSEEVIDCIGAYYKNVFFHDSSESAQAVAKLHVPGIVEFLVITTYPIAGRKYALDIVVDAKIPSRSIEFRCLFNGLETVLAKCDDLVIDSSCRETKVTQSDSMPDPVKERRFKKAYIGYLELIGILNGRDFGCIIKHNHDLPDDFALVDIKDEWWNKSLAFTVAHYSFDPVPDGCRIPNAGSVFVLADGTESYSFGEVIRDGQIVRDDKPYRYVRGGDGAKTDSLEEADTNPDIRLPDPEPEVVVEQEKKINFREFL